MEQKGSLGCQNEVAEGALATESTIPTCESHFFWREARHRAGNLSNLYYNARRILPKLDALKTNCWIYNPVVICIVESWLNDEANDSELSITDYSVVRW